MIMYIPILEYWIYKWFMKLMYSSVHIALSYYNTKQYNLYYTQISSDREIQEEKYILQFKYCVDG